jgi:hypothetical protein
MMPLIAVPFIGLAIAILAGLGAGFMTKHRKEEITTDEQRLWAAIVKAQQTGKPDDFISAANLARILGKPKTADELTAQATAAAQRSMLAARAGALARNVKPSSKKTGVNGEGRPTMAYLYQHPNDAYAVRMAIGPTWAERKEMGIFDNVDLARNVAEGNAWRLAWYEPKDLKVVLALAQQKRIA